jgi:ABC-2 type transport system permease protein
MSTATDRGGESASEPAVERERTRGTGGYLTLTWAMAKKRLLLMYRYPLNTFSGLATTMIFFAMIFFGGQALSAQAMSESLAGIIVGFFLFTLAMTAFSGLSWRVTRESQWGTLEQLYMSPFGFGRVMGVHVLVRIIESFLWGGITLGFMLALTGETLTLNVVTVVVVATLALTPAIGIGFVFGGLALLFKRVENVFQIVQFVFIGLIAAPATGFSWVHFLPVSQGSAVLSSVMQQGVRLWEIPLADMALLVGAAVFYLGFGYAVFQWASLRARRQGLMGNY